MKPTKYEKLMAVMERFYALTQDIPDAELRQLNKYWVESKTKIESWLGDPTTGIKKSAVAEGLEQGLREMPGLLQRSLPIESRQKALIALNVAVNEFSPSFFAKDRERLTKVCARGRINNEAEFYMVRHEVDILEGDPQRKEELSSLYALLAKFEYGPAA